MTEFIFKQSLIDYDKAKKALKYAKAKFEADVMYFMEQYDIPVKVLYFGDTFGLDIRVNTFNFATVPRKIPLDVLMEFCKEFGCEFQYTCCDGSRWIFTFNGLDLGY